MLNLTLHRHYYTSRGTLGALFHRGVVVCYTLELPQLDNTQNTSCIPTGSYIVDYLPRSNSGKYREVYHIVGVQDRAGILIHKGNTVNHTKGCVLIGMMPGRLVGGLAVLNSARALRRLHTITNRKRFKIHVRDDYSSTK